jgi:hypothetical protein
MPVWLPWSMFIHSYVLLGKCFAVVTCFGSFITVHTSSCLVLYILQCAFVSHSEVHRFLSPLLPPPEPVFYPASLTFGAVSLKLLLFCSYVSYTDACVLTDGACLQLRFKGIQRQMLSELLSQGSTALLQPAKLFAACVSCGLIPRGADSSPFDVPVVCLFSYCICTPQDSSF